MNFFDKIARLLGAGSQEATARRADAAWIREVRDSGRWRQALIDLDALGQRVFTDRYSRAA